MISFEEFKKLADAFFENVSSEFIVKRFEERGYILESYEDDIHESEFTFSDESIEWQPMPEFILELSEYSFFEENVEYKIALAA